MTHSPDILRRQHRLWAINSAFEIDLLGQANAEYAGRIRIASAGGQADFFRAAHQCDGGAAVLVIPARAKDGRSRIVADLGSSRRVTSAAADIDYVVTEFGIAHLTAAQRARWLTAIAHPQDRDALTRNWNDASPAPASTALAAAAMQPARDHPTAIAWSGEQE